MAPVTPAFTTVPTASTALALFAAAMSSPVTLFLKPKSPVMVTKLAMVALSPVTATAVTPFKTFNGAVIVLPAMLMLSVRASSVPVLL